MHFQVEKMKNKAIKNAYIEPNKMSFVVVEEANIIKSHMQKEDFPYANSLPTNFSHMAQVRN